MGAHLLKRAVSKQSKDDGDDAEISGEGVVVERKGYQWLYGQQDEWKKSCTVCV